MTDNLRKIAGKYFLFLTLFGLMGLVSTSYAGSDPFKGTWIGTGTVTFKGRPDPIFCKVRNILKAGRTYYSTFSCTIPRLGKGSLTIESDRIAANKYKGKYEDEYNNNPIHLNAKVDGSKMNVKVSSKSWNGFVNFVKK